jgi:hypothetical protein
MHNLTWTCHVCGKERPDDKISVRSTEALVGGIAITQNVRYCNDNPDCVEGSTKVDWLKGPAHYSLEREDSND